MRVAMITGVGRVQIDVSAEAKARRAHVERLAEGLAAGGHDVRIYASAPHQPEPTSSSVRVLALAPEEHAGPRDLVSISRRFGSWLADQWTKDWAPQVAHAHFYTSGLAALVASGACGAPLIETFHSLGPTAFGAMGAPPAAEARRISYEQLVATRADAVIAQSSDEIKTLVSLRVPRESIALVPAAVDETTYQPEGPSIRSDPNHPRLLSVGPLNAGSGHADVIRALQYAPEAELVIVGGSPEPELRDDPNVRTLVSLAREVGVSRRVRLAGGVTTSALPAWYRSATALIWAARNGARAGCALEAMACGAPVIAYDVPRLRDVVVEGVTGDLVPSADVRALGLAVRRLLGQAFRQAQYGIAAADRARHRFGWSRATDQVLRVYEKVAATDHGG